MLIIPVGNVTADTELTYEYGVRTKKKRAQAAAAPTSASDQDQNTPKDKGIINFATFLLYRIVYTLISGASASPKAPPKVPPMTIDGKPHLPFQLQIEYTAQDGSRNRRVITDAKPITKEREVAERGIKVL